MPPVGAEVIPGGGGRVGAKEDRCGRHCFLSVLSVLCRVVEECKGASQCFPGPTQPLQFVVSLRHCQISARASTVKADPTVPVDRAPSSCVLELLLAIWN